MSAVSGSEPAAREEFDPEGLASVPAEELVGSSYRSIRRIGSGGMADVFEVEHVRLGARFAAKILRPGRDAWESSVRRFLREARLLARLKSEHIVRVFDVSESAHDPPFYVMELLEGRDLRALVRANELSVARASKIVADACAGLAVAHASGLVHRDLKPENLFITHRDSGEEVCKLLDFGVSKARGPTTTEAGALIGTLAYMAPEQIESAGTVTASADIYALGAILYEALAGRPPHIADTVERLLFTILTVTPEPVRKYRRDVPEELDRIILRALSRRPEDRFVSAAEFLHALGPFTNSVGLLTGSTLRNDPASVSDPSPGGKRRPVWPALVAFGGAVVALAALTHQGAPAGDALGARASATEPRPSPLPAASTPPAPIAASLASGLEHREAPSSANSLVASPARAAATRRRPLPTSSASSRVVSSPPGAALPKIQFELENPYAH